MGDDSETIGSVPNLANAIEFLAHNGNCSAEVLGYHPGSTRNLIVPAEQVYSKFSHLSPPTHRVDHHNSNLSKLTRNKLSVDNKVGAALVIIGLWQGSPVIPQS